LTWVNQGNAAPRDRERRIAMKILLAVDGSKNAMDAVECLIAHAGWYREKPHVELVTVHLPVPPLPNLHKVVTRSQLQRYYDEEGQANLERAAARLKRAGLQFNRNVLVGPIAESIDRHAKVTGCDLILVGTRGMSAAANAMLGSVSNKLLQITKVPVLLVK
jgi:nucleotide-binding universal stress UspA family protein